MYVVSGYCLIKKNNKDQINETDKFKNVLLSSFI